MPVCEHVQESPHVPIRAQPQVFHPEASLLPAATAQAKPASWPGNFGVSPISTSHPPQREFWNYSYVWLYTGAEDSELNSSCLDGKHLTH